MSKYSISERMDIKQAPAGLITTIKVQEQDVDLLKIVMSMDDIKQFFINFCNIIGLPIALIDLQANVLISSPWQKACTDYHRVNSHTCTRCTQSHMTLANQLQEDKQYAMYTCENGLTECASPLILNNQHVANVFIGQFLLEQPNIEFFTKQAQQAGFNTKAYLLQIQQIPIVTSELLPQILECIVSLTALLSKLVDEKIKAKQATKDLVNYKNSLEEQVKERTQQLQESQIKTMQLNERLKRLNGIDELTQVHNRRYLMEQLHIRWRDHIEMQHPISFIMIDIDFFKPYNDSYGHLFGDSCLKQVAQAMSKELQRSNDLLARYGGEEFSVVISGGIEVAERIAQRLKAAVTRLNIEHNQSEFEIISISLGLSSITPRKDSNMQQLIKQADIALYESKGAGRNRVSIFKEELVTDFSVDKYR